MEPGKTPLFEKPKTWFSVAGPSTMKAKSRRLRTLMALPRLSLIKHSATDDQGRQSQEEKTERKEDRLFFQLAATFHSPRKLPFEIFFHPSSAPLCPSNEESNATELSLQHDSCKSLLSFPLADSIFLAPTTQPTSLGCLIPDFYSSHLLFIAHSASSHPSD
ncbi:uncharacterized protein BJX67DRAFT_290830 [Aspergillus lucknowensis]|uniref:Uncharacterized protein n=1 Tax=Aspergillus lucknowensis TaxID=176173 RepID=A0ABR4LE63_9EURO